MDYTLAIYKKLPMEQLQYDLTLDRLIKEHDYPAEVSELKYDASFIIRGLLVDKYTGHLIKINSHNRVKRACFGRRQLLESEIEAYYHNEKIRLSDPRFASLDTLFAMPEACLFANLVDFFQDLLLRGQNVAPLSISNTDSPCNDVGFDTSCFATFENPLMRYIATAHSKKQSRMIFRPISKRIPIFRLCFTSFVPLGKNSFY